MRSVRGRNNRTTELALKMALVRRGISGWKMHLSSVPGRPDFTFEAARAAIFVDGCFWHGCPKCGHTPRTNRAYWKTKIDLNRQRDKMTTRILRKSGYAVLRFWEHEIAKCLESCAAGIANLLRPSNRRNRKRPDL